MEGGVERSGYRENLFHPDGCRRGNRVRELREMRLMTQQQLAQKARVAVRTIQSIEKGMECRMDTKRKILIAFGLSWDQMRRVFIEGRKRGMGAES